jgi:hypothetical protein
MAKDAEQSDFFKPIIHSKLWEGEGALYSSMSALNEYIGQEGLLKPYDTDSEKSSSITQKVNDAPLSLSLDTYHSRTRNEIKKLPLLVSSTRIEYDPQKMFSKFTEPPELRPDISIFKTTSWDSKSHMQPSPYQETLLSNGFEGFVQRLDIATLAVGRPEKPIAHLGRYSFAGLEGTALQEHSDVLAGASFSIFPTARMTYGKSFDGRPWMDTQKAVGLLYDDHLIAISGAYVMCDGRNRSKKGNSWS